MEDTRIIKRYEGEEPKVDKISESENHNKILRNIFLVIGVFALVFVGTSFYMNSLNSFEYEGLNFKKIQQGEITFYNIFYPMYSKVTGKHTADYNFYIRNDPRDLEDIPFDGDLIIKSNMVLNVLDDFGCEGKGVIAVANLAKLYGFFGTKVIKDFNATCDDEGRYMFVQVLKGNETRIEQTGSVCYNIYVKDCEILEGTERFMLETFLEVKR